MVVIDWLDSDEPGGQAEECCPEQPGREVFFIHSSNIQHIPKQSEEWITSSATKPQDV